jgi:signal transduction histidine kinase
MEDEGRHGAPSTNVHVTLSEETSRPHGVTRALALGQLTAPSFAPQFETLRLFSGCYFLILGMSFLLLPQGPLGVWLQPIWIPAACLVAAGLVILWLAVLKPTRRIAFVLSALFALPLLVIAGANLLLGGISTAAILGFLTIGMILAPLAAPGNTHATERPDALGLALGGVVLVQGLDFMIRPQPPTSVPGALGIPALPLGLILVCSGSAVIAVQLIGRVSSIARWVVHIVCGLAVLALQVAIATFVDPLYWALGAAAMLRGVATLTLPWWNRHAASFDRSAFRPRLALALVTAALVPVGIALPIVLAAIPQESPELALAQQMAFGSTLFVILLAGVGGWWLAGNLSAPLEHLMREVDQIALGQHNLPLPRQAVTELAALSQAVEEMAHTLDMRAEERTALLEREQLARIAAEAAAQRTASLQRVTAALSGALTRDEVAHVILTQGIAMLDAVAGTVVVLADDGTTLEVLNAVGYPADLVRQWQRFQLAALTPLSHAVQVGQPVILESRLAGTQNYPALAEMGHVFGDGAIAAFPLRVHNQVIGGLGLSFHEPRAFTPDELALVTNLVQQCAQALERAQLYQSEQQARADAQDAVRARDVFLSIAAHELKNPLTALLGNAQLLARRMTRAGTLSQHDQHVLTGIIDQASRLNQMIAALLDLSHVDTGQLRIAPAPMDIAALARRVVDTIAPTVPTHRITYAAPAEPLVVAGDELRLEQAIQNLIGNALKYSPNGGAVEVRLAAQGQHVCISISDEGIGIPNDALPNLFRRFYRAPNVEGQSIEGIGVGLYVVKEIISLHGGEIKVVSSEGQGSTFTICLPLLHDADARQPEAGV